MWLENEEVRALALHKLSFVKCPCCDMNGLQYWDGRTGLGVNNSPVGLDTEDMCFGGCEECDGVGFILTGSY